MKSTLHLEKLSAKNEHIALPWIDQFELIAKEFPHHKAIVNPSGEHYTYQQVDLKANQLSRYLHNMLLSHRVEKEQIILALCTSRTNLDISVMLIAALKVGAAVHILEPKLGADVNGKRLMQIKPDLIILDQEYSDLEGDFSNFNTLVLNAHQPNIEQILTSPLNINCERNNALVLCSSGTTGEPKVMVIPMLPLANLTRAGHEELNIDHKSNVAQLARRNFDAFFHEILITLGNGACLVLLEDPVLFCPEQFATFVRQYSISHITITPSHMGHLLQKRRHRPDKIFSAVETIMLIGEGFTEVLLHNLVETGVSRVVNGYGPSETGIWAMSAILFDQSTSNKISAPHLGKPIRGVDVRVMRQNTKTQLWQLCGVGEQGELFISNRLQNVYLDPKKNQNSYLYLPDPITNNIECFYRTGDIVTISKTHDLEFVGRRDNQVKISGQLVVTDEVSNQLKLACQQLFKDMNINIYVDIEKNKQGVPTSLTAYHTASDAKFALYISNRLSDYLSSQLPTYMQPARYAWVAEFPVKVSGKLDVDSIKSHARNSKQADGPKIKPHTRVQTYIAELWQQTLALDTPVYLHDVFNELGGTSLQVNSMLSRLNHEFKTSLKIDSVIKRVTLKELAHLIETSVQGNNSLQRVNKLHSHTSEALEASIHSLIEMKASDGKDNLFLVHPGDGHIQVYQKLVNQLAENVRVFGLRAPGSEAGEKIEAMSVEDFAERYAQLIMTQQPKGNISLLGYCAGAPIAVEVARLIEKTGRKISLLALLDMPNGYHSPENIDISQGLASFFAQRYQSKISAKELRCHSDSLEDQYDYLFGHAQAENKVSHSEYGVIRDALTGVMYEPEEDDPRETMRLFFKYAFKLDIDHKDLHNKGSFEEQLDFIVAEGKRLGLFPHELNTDYFTRLLAMENMSKNAIHGYVPSPLDIHGKILYLHATPSITNPMAWYPNSDTWREFIPTMHVHQLSGDHYSIVRDENDIKEMLHVLETYSDFLLVG
ncbi:hypothetical protein BS333_16560 [Vibrio azureus]|uniref:Carrier domain-containing protein n=1 Tax=Vibrio azureus NBRC 104587 TaxID=1219077 RepID=U3CCL3_9VIBR|nr:AMP-binding protein [Vibrio azureus]AUI87994.1 hypothetical protein BS333_16560 [Vibrio azureus]GAD76093.1 hypothetical protein VAZ01S_036_00370 [Vibrio azureus NBRC 104587]